MSKKKDIKTTPRIAGRVSVLLEWKRGRGRRTDLSEVMCWESRCQRYRVERHKSTLCRDKPKKDRLSDVYYAMVYVEDRWDIISAGGRLGGRTKKVAEQRCLSHAKTR